MKCNNCGKTAFVVGKRFCKRSCFFEYRLEHRKEFILTQIQRDKLSATKLKKNGMKKDFSDLGWHGKYNREWRKKNPEYYRKYNKPRFLY